MISLPFVEQQPSYFLYYTQNKIKYLSHPASLRDTVGETLAKSVRGGEGITHSGWGKL